MLHTIAINVYNYANEQNGGMHRLADKMLKIKLAMARSQLAYTTDPKLQCSSASCHACLTISGLSLILGLLLV